MKIMHGKYSDVKRGVELVIGGENKYKERRDGP